MDRDLRRYCPSKHVNAFDEYSTSARAAMQRSNRFRHHATQVTLDHYDRLNALDALREPGAFLSALDDQGIAATVLFAGGGNDEVLPWSVGPGAGDARIDSELRIVGEHIWNEWLADFVPAAPERLVGVMQQPIWDLDRAIEEIHWGAGHGLRAINFPARDPTIRPTTSRSTTASGLRSKTSTSLSSVTEAAARAPVVRRPRCVPTLLLGDELVQPTRVLADGVRRCVRPSSQTARRVHRAARWMDRVRDCRTSTRATSIRNVRSPTILRSSRASIGATTASWAQASWLGSKRTARDEIGVETITWGGDFPHVEGTWPNTTLALRNTFAGIPESEVRMMLGTNALRIYQLDEQALRPIADRIGPMPSEIDLPLSPDETPAEGRPRVPDARGLGVIV